VKRKTGQIILISQFFILLAFLLLTIGNEIFDLPHLLLGDQPTSSGQRSGEILLEIFFFVAIIGIEFILIKNLLNRIKILEGFLPICANCKKIRHEENWHQLESYISDHSLAKFSHTICPDCRKKLYQGK
jgi:hypothetical protein